MSAPWRPRSSAPTASRPAPPLASHRHQQHPHPRPARQGRADTDLDWRRGPAPARGPPPRPQPPQHLGGAQGRVRLPPRKPPPLRVAVYFGSFDPVHENHMAVCQHALAALGMDKIVLVPNLDNPFKPALTPLRVRLRMLQAQLTALGAQAVSAFDATAACDRLDWHGRALVCRAIRARALDQAAGGAAQLRELGHAGPRAAPPPQVAMFQLMGQDSFEAASAQAALAQHRVRRNLQRTLVVFPRGGAGGATRVPPALRDMVVVARDYHDARPGLSSTAIRSAISEGHGEPDSMDASVASHAAPTPATVEGVHPAVLALARELGLYPQPVSAPGVFVAVVNGPPGAGKSTLGRHLAAELGASFRSPGDFYRLGQASDCAAFHRLDALQHTDRGRWANWLTALLHGCLKVVMAESSGARFVFDNISDLHAFQRGVLAGGAVDVCITLDCDEAVLLERLRARNRPGEDPARRLKGYGRRRLREATVLKGLRAAFGGCTTFLDLDAAPPVAEYLAASSPALAAIRARADAKAPAAVQAGSGGGGEAGVEAAGGAGAGDLGVLRRVCEQLLGEFAPLPLEPAPPNPAP